MNSLKAAAAFGLTVLLANTAAAQNSAASSPVGYETLTFSSGFTPVGLRLHEAPVASGVITAVDDTSISASGTDFTSVLDADTEYVLEIEGDSGVIAVINTWAGSDITTPSSLVGEVTVNTTTFTLRPVATLATVFGAANSAGLATGSGSSAGADQVWVPDGSGNFNRYYFDLFAPPAFSDPGWVQTGQEGGVADALVDAATINLVYADGVVMNSPAGGEFVVTGSVKLTNTELSVNPGFTFVSSVAPTGANLATAFGSEAVDTPDITSSIATGSGSSAGADQIWVPDGSGNFNRYYFDLFAPPGFASPSWVQTGQDGAVDAAVNGSTIELPSGFVVNSTAGGNVVQAVPGFYSTL